MSRIRETGNYIPLFRTENAMRKLKLNFDQLTVDSFVTTTPQERSGTVFGKEFTFTGCLTCYDTCNNGTCDETCGSCVGNTCGYSCGCVGTYDGPDCGPTARYTFCHGVECY